MLHLLNQLQGIFLSLTALLTFVHKWQTVSKKNHKSLYYLLSPTQLLHQVESKSLLLFGKDPGNLKCF